MKVEVKKRTSWLDVVNAARFTQHLKPIIHEPSTSFKRSILLAEHSPIRDLEFEINLYDVPFHVVSHLVRYSLGCNKYVATSRPDITGAPISRHEQRKDDPTDVKFVMNAQAILKVSRERLCVHAEDETRKVWKQVLISLADTDPILVEKCVPNCIYRGFCPEMNSCGYSETMPYLLKLNEYRARR